MQKSTSKPTHFADRAIETLFCALFFFVPLVFWPGTSEVFEFNKMLLVYVLTILIAAIWVTKWIDQKKITIRRTPLDIPILLFFASQILSTIFSVDTHTSLWGYYSRFHGGLMSTVSYIVLYYAFVTNIQISNIKYQILNILISAALVSLYGVLEHFGIDKQLWVQDVQNRVFSTLGQPNWLSAYLVTLLPLPIFLATQHYHRHSGLDPESIQIDSRFRGNDMVTFLFYLLIAIGFLVTIFFTKSQSGLGATAVVLGTILVYSLGRKFKIIYPLTITLLLFGLITKWSLVEKISPLGPPNLAELVQQDNQNRFGGSDSLLIRQVVWQGARKLALQNPLFGTGVETFGYAYFTVRPALHNLLSEWEFLYNKAHNEYLNLLATTGFFGLTTYLVFTFASLKLLWPSPFFFGYLGIIITNYFGFSVVPVALFFYLFPALHFVGTNPNKHYLSLNFNINKLLGLILLLLATGYSLSAISQMWTADLAYNRGKQYLTQKYLKASLDNFERATQISPNEPLFWAQLAETEAMAASSVRDQLNSPPTTISAETKTNGLRLINSLMALAEENVDRAIAMNPHQTNYYKAKAKVELYLGTIDPKYNQAAVQTLLKLIELSPTDAKVFFNIGLLYQSLGQDDQAKVYFQKALDLKPDYDAAMAALKSI